MDDAMNETAKHVANPGYADLVSGFRWDVPATFNFGVDVVDHWANTGDGLALIWSNAAGETQSFRYSDIARASNRLANVLRSNGIKKGDRVMVMLPRRPEWMIAIVGIMKIGAVPIPAIEMLTARDVAYRMTNSRARGAICRAEHTAKFETVRGDLATALSLGAAEGWLDWAHETEAAPETLEPAVMDAEDPAIMYYTSGSTGSPKGVIHSARGIYSWRMTARYWLDLRPGETIWCTADTGWSKAGTSILFGPWSCGACSFFYDGPFDPAKRLELLSRNKVTVYCAPSTELSRIVEQDVSAYDLSALRRIVSAGESMNPAIARRFEEASGVRIDEAYGQTECLMVTVNLPGEEVRYGSMGRAAPGCDLDVVDVQGNRLPCDEEGDVALMTPNPQIMLGYWRDPDRTAGIYLECAEGTWLLTGDRAIRDKDGYFWFRGRSDDTINSAGYRIGPLEVENTLLEHAAVQACAVVGSPDADRGEIVKAFVILRAGFPASDTLTAELQDHVKAITAPYKYPRAIEYVSELPMTLTGKIRRRTLRDMEYEKAKAPQ